MSGCNLEEFYFLIVGHISEKNVFKSIELAITDEKWVEISTGKWNEKNEERKKEYGIPNNNRMSAL